MGMRDYNNNESLTTSKVYNDTATFFVLVPVQTSITLPMCHSKYFSYRSH
jgi:hypothetical protein